MAATLPMNASSRPRAVVVGLGATGYSCVQHLVARGYEVRVADTRAAPPRGDDLCANFAAVPTHFGVFDAGFLADADLLVVSPGVALAEPAIQSAIAQGVEVAGDIELFARAAKAPVLAITGSNGKSTVTALTGELLKAGGCKVLVGGNIGVPALDLLNETVPDFYVLELSSFQLETTTNLDARAAVILNLSPDHLDRYPGLREYTAAKARIWRGRGTVILNRDDAGVQAIAQPLAAARRKLVSFGLNAPASADDFGIMLRDGAATLTKGPHDIMPVSEVPLPGRHNLANVLAAAALADQARVAPVAIRAGVRDFHGLPHRTEVIGERNGVRYINDSKGTNVGATVAALAGMDTPVVLIAGGLGKGQAFDALREACRQHARAVVLIGQDANRIEAALAGVVPVHRADSMQSAVRAARDAAQAGDVVLLSPACASFDMFRDYRDRGEAFARAVRGLPA